MPEKKKQKNIENWIFYFENNIKWSRFGLNK